MARFYERDYDDYLIELGDRVQFDDPYGKTMRGTVEGRGAAGSYLKIRGDNGQVYEAYSSDPDVRKIFPEDEFKKAWDR
jgi:hypothetical protein